MARPWKNPGRLGAARTSARMRIRDSLCSVPGEPPPVPLGAGPGDTPLHCRGGERAPLSADADHLTQGREHPTRGRLHSTTARFTARSTTPRVGGPGGGGAPHEWRNPRSAHRAVQSAPQSGETPPHRGVLHGVLYGGGHSHSFTAPHTNPRAGGSGGGGAPHEWRKPRSTHRAVQSAPRPGDPHHTKGRSPRSPLRRRTLAFLHHTIHHRLPGGLGGTSISASKNAARRPSPHAGHSPTKGEHPQGGGPYSTTAPGGWTGSMVFTTVQPFSGPPNSPRPPAALPPPSTDEGGASELATG